MFRRPLFWVALFAASLGCIVFSARFFSRAFPLVTIDLRMNRESALARAAELSTRFKLPPSDYREVATFGGDQEVQNFVELEGGGTAAFRSMMIDGLYHPFKWSVRHFKPGETRETLFSFTPSGDPYGFFVKLPEKEAGAALGGDRAREIAEQTAAVDWKADLNRYRLVEKSQEIRPGGRIDHTFVYERPDVRVGEGLYRLRLGVGGDRLTELRYFVKVPEAFSRRYEATRSANELIGTSGSIALALLYVVGGCGAGMFYLLRQRWIIWRKPLIWGIFIAFLQLIAGINQWPLLWVGYDTAISAQGFAIQQITMIVLSFLAYAGLFTVTFTAAESLTRRAFPDQPQMWSLWSPELAGSRPVLGQTVAGYLLVGVFFAYEVLLYFVANRSLGWWTPSDALIQPDILATYLPWLSPIAISAQAGFWEECLFRAVPLAGAALLGSRFGRRNWWIAGAMILQAVIFGSCHAGYANQPSYARLVELIIPSFMFGGLYLAFGLLPGIVLHYIFDVVWLALPLFVSSAPGIWWHRITVIILVLVPMWIVISGRLRGGAWVEMKVGFLNRDWRPPNPVVHEITETRPASGSINPVVLRFIPLLGLIGLMLWGFATRFSSDAPALTLSRPEAQATARRALSDRGIVLPPSWAALTSVSTNPGEQSRFVWQTGGRESYQKLLDEYLAPPHWFVRFVRFDGDVADSAEEYQLWISDSKGAFRLKHVLPEGRSGKSISEQDARSLAHQAIKRECGLDAAVLKEVTASPSKLKDRTDWVFFFSDPRPPALSQGEKRIGVAIGGDQVLDVNRFIHVPEEWKRQQNDKETIPNVVRIMGTVLTMLMVVTGIVWAIYSWSRKQFEVYPFLVMSPVLLLLGLAGTINSLPTVVSMFSTSQPFKVQMFLVLGMSILRMVVMSAGIGLVTGLVHFWCRDAAMLPARPSLILGLSFGGILAGLTAAGLHFRPSLAPLWGDFGFLGVYFPILDKALDPLIGFLQMGANAMLLFLFVNRLSRQWTDKRLLSAGLLLLFGFAVAGARGPEVISSWLLEGAILGVLLLAGYWTVIRFSIPAVLIAVALSNFISIIKSGIISHFSGGITGSLLGIAGIAAAMVIWYRRISRPRP